MLQLSATLLNKAVLSLRTGSPVANVQSVIVNPNNLKIEGFYCQDKFSKEMLILLVQDIREILPQGFVVEEEDLVRLKDVLELNFSVINKQVVTIDKQKVGKVSDYAAETNSMYIQK